MRPSNLSQSTSTPAPWRVLLSVLLGLMALLALLPTVFGIAFVLPIMTSERVYMADAQQINPELDGKLVKIHFQHIYADGQQAQDEFFSLSNKGIALKREYTQTPGQRVHYHTVHEIKQCIHIAPRICAGAYALNAKSSDFWFSDRRFQQEIVPTSEYSVPQELQPYVKEVKDNELVLLTGDTGPAASQTASLTFNYVPSELKGDFYLVGRQVGNTLHVTQILLCEQEMHTHTRAAAPPAYPAFLKYAWLTILLSYAFMSFCVMCIYRLLCKDDKGSVRCALSLVFAAVSVLVALWFNFCYFLASASISVYIHSAWFPYASILVALLACWLYSRARRLRIK